MESNIKINKNLPLLICDADEVIFKFMDTFDYYLENKNMYFSYETFKLNGNIKNKDTDQAINSDDIPRLISNFFKMHTLDMPLIKNAKKTLEELSNKINIVILSNIPMASSNDRIACLKKHNMHYNFISNEGTKGNKCMELAKLTNKNVFFVDDLPNQISSVSKTCKEIITIHFLQNEKLIKIIPEIKDCDYKVNNWKSIKKIILNNI
jgi:hypothetical protein